MIVKCLDRRYKWDGGSSEVKDHWDEALTFAANLASFYSDFRQEKRAEITMAEPKHILKPAGAPLGSVKIRKEVASIIGNPFSVPVECRQNG